MRFLAILIFPVLLAAADTPANRCATAKPFSPGPGDWNGWGVDANSRFQPQPGLAAADVPKLKLKWAFGFPGETRAVAAGDLGRSRICGFHRRHGLLA